MIDRLTDSAMSAMAMVGLIVDDMWLHITVAVSNEINFPAGCHSPSNKAINQ